MKRNKRKNTEVFINECIEVRGYKYDYSLVSYKNNKQKVKIICKDHGIFEQTPNNHLKKKLRFDFYLPELNTCIEFDGRQHFESIKYYGGDKGLEIRTIRDKIKSEFCKINKINLIRIKFDDDIKKKIYECLS